eukprot:491369-Prymnesium_polylepis.1
MVRGAQRQARRGGAQRARRAAISGCHRLSAAVSGCQRLSAAVSGRVRGCLRGCLRLSAAVAFGL